MTMPKREVNNIWSRVRADVDVDDLILSMTDITPMRMVIRAVIGDRGVHPHAAGTSGRRPQQV